MSRTMFAALLAATPLSANAMPAQTASTSTIAPMVPATGAVLDVVAEGKTTRTPDLATIRAGVVAQAPTAKAALSDNATRMARVLAALRSAGIAERDLQTATVSLSPQYRYTNGQPPAITGYQASNSVSVRFRDIARSGVVLDTLVAQGANQIDGPDLSVSEPEAALDEARADAVKRARARADLYARAAGLRVGRIVSITEGATNTGGGMQPPIVFAARAMRAEAPTEIAPGERDVSATLTVRFLLE